MNFKSKNKKAAVAAIAAALLLFAGCAKENKSEDGVLKVGASPSPHAELLEVVKPILEKQGIKLEIQEFSDYILPNEALENKELDANFFQHEPYLKDFNEKNGTHLESLGKIHFEAMGIYSQSITALDQLKKGAKIGVPSDTTNEARALQLLAAQGLIELKKGVGLEATIKDIDKNPLELEFVEMEAAALPRSLADVDAAVINGNYALKGDVIDSLILSEDADSEAAETFANVVAVRKGDDRKELKALVKALQGEEVRQYIEENYKTVFPASDSAAK